MIDGLSRGGDNFYDLGVVLGDGAAKADFLAVFAERASGERPAVDGGSGAVT